MESRLNINVSAIDYDKTSKALTQQLTFLEEMVHGQDGMLMELRRKRALIKMVLKWEPGQNME